MAPGALRLEQGQKQEARLLRGWQVRGELTPDVLAFTLSPPRKCQHAAVERPESPLPPRREHPPVLQGEDVVPERLLLGVGEVPEEGCGGRDEKGEYTKAP